MKALKIILDLKIIKLRFKNIFVCLFNTNIKLRNQKIEKIVHFLVYALYSFSHPWLLIYFHNYCIYYIVFPNVSHVFSRFFDEMAAYAQPTHMVFYAMKIPS